MKLDKDAIYRKFEVGKGQYICPLCGSIVEIRSSHHCNDAVIFIGWNFLEISIDEDNYKYSLYYKYPCNDLQINWNLSAKEILESIILKLKLYQVME